MRKRAGCIGTVFGILFMLLGTGFFFYPEAAAILQKWQAVRYVEAFDEQKVDAEKEMSDNQEDDPEADGTENSTGDSAFGSDETALDKENNPLYQQMLFYNEDLYASGQENFTDAWIITQVPDELQDFDVSSVGYIETPAMDVTLPLYIGATTENMAKGAVVLGQTSMPIGGENTNCVIAGHRGYRGAPYFREIEDLEIGDYVYITNPWETLVYQAAEIEVIDPYDTEKLLIQEGRDMVTLVTCHPYRSHGKYRYIVYCERVTGFSFSDETGTESSIESKASSGKEIETDDKTTGDEEFVSSKEDIKSEKYFRIGSFVLIMILFLLTVTRKRKE